MGWSGRGDADGQLHAESGIITYAGEDLDGWSQGRRPRSRRATSEGGAASDQASRRSTGVGC